MRARILFFVVLTSCGGKAEPSGSQSPPNTAGATGGTPSTSVGGASGGTADSAGGGAGGALQGENHIVFTSEPDFGVGVLRCDDMSKMAGITMPCQIGQAPYYKLVCQAGINGPQKGFGVDGFPWNTPLHVPIDLMTLQKSSVPGFDLPILAGTLSLYQSLPQQRGITADLSIAIAVDNTVCRWHSGTLTAVAGDFL